MAETTTAISMVEATQVLVTLVSVVMVFFFYAQFRKGRAGWEVLFVTTAEIFTYATMLILGTGAGDNSSIIIDDPSVAAGQRSIKWLRYAGWLVTCPVMLINLAHVGSKSGSNITFTEEEESMHERSPASPGSLFIRDTKALALRNKEEEQYSMASMMVLLTLDEGMIICGITAAFSEYNSTSRIVLYILGCLCGIGLYVQMFKIFFNNWMRHPYARQWITTIAILFFASWLLYPILWAIGEEGSGLIDVKGTAIGHGLADLVAKNTVGIMIWYLRQRVIPFEEAKLAEIAALGESYKQASTRSKQRKRRVRGRGETRRRRREEQDSSDDDAPSLSLTHPAMPGQSGGRSRGAAGGSGSKRHRGRKHEEVSFDDEEPRKDSMMPAVVVTPDAVYQVHLANLLQNEGYSVTSSRSPEALHRELTLPNVSLKIAVINGNSLRDYVNIYGRSALPSRDDSGPLILAMAPGDMDLASARKEFISLGAHEVLLEPYDSRAFYEAVQRFKTPPTQGDLDEQWSQDTPPRAMSERSAHSRHSRHGRGGHDDDDDDVDDEPHAPRSHSKLDDGRGGGNPGAPSSTSATTDSSAARPWLMSMFGTRDARTASRDL